MYDKDTSSKMERSSKKSDAVLVTIGISIGLLTIPLVTVIKRSIKTNNHNKKSSSSSSPSSNNEFLRSFTCIDNLLFSMRRSTPDSTDNAPNNGTSTNNDESSNKRVKFAAGTSDLQRQSLVKGGQTFKKYNEDNDGDIIARKHTPIEEQVLKNVFNAENIVQSLPKTDNDIPAVDLFLPEMLKDALFVGHLVTDLDSVAGAIGAAALYGGKAVIASDVNSETQFALDYWKVETPPRIEDVLKEKPDLDVCLVDHQQTSQMNPCINVDKIVGVIDHHALQSKTIVTDKPIYIDIRPWGSMSTM